MEPKPVQSQREPAYPTRREVLAGAASAALVNLIGCDFVLAETEGGGITVAPIFAHGEGRGATGCTIAAPPAFLSEEEGMQIVREELAKHGINLKAGGTWEAVRLRARIEKHKLIKREDGHTVIKDSIAEAPREAKPLKLGGIDADKKIAVEFISFTNYRDLGGLINVTASENYDFKNTAEYVADQVKNHGKEDVFFGAFYDPAANAAAKEPKDRKTDRKGRMERSMKESEELLRRQAQDFVDWLKEQKAIK
jgi:hypothetical protein